MKKSLLLLFAVLLSTALYSQNTAPTGKKVKPNEPSTEYDRIAITYLLLDFGTGNYYNMLKQSFAQVKVDDKYDDNTIKSNILPSPIKREETVNSFVFNPRTPDNVSFKIKDALIANHAANAVIAKWFSRKEDGSFGVELLQQRGLYNATDADVAAANASKLGIAKLMDAGEKLLNNSYIIVMDVNDLIDMDEAYNRQQKNSKTTINRIKNGFKATMNAYVFKINFNDTINAIFWSELWADANSPDLQQRKAKFDSYNFPLTYCTRTTAMVEASQYNTGQALAPKVQASAEQMLVKLLQDGINNNLGAIENNLEEFRVKTAIFSTHPIEAKIGKKEGLKTDHRYFVYEMEMDETGKVIAKRKGVIRATKHIVDNRGIATGQTATSRFYQVGGGRLDAGMLLQQRNDAGLALSLGYAAGGVGGFDARLDFNLTRLLGAKMPTMLKLYIEGGFDGAEEHVSVGNEEAIRTYSNFMRLGAGIGKELCFLHYFRLQPFVGFGLEQATDKDDKTKTLSTLYARAGATFGINIRHNLQLVGTFGPFAPVGKITNADNESTIVNDEEKWKDAFKRGGNTSIIGLRFEF